VFAGGLVKNTCATCGAFTEAIYRLCHPCLVERTIAERAAAGLPTPVEDPETLHKVAVLIAASRPAR
jgi:hypothetical protein